MRSDVGEATRGAARGRAQSWRGEERLFEAIANYTYDWESWMGPDGRPRWINPTVERMTGYRAAECLTMPDYPLPIVHPDDRPGIADHLRAAAAGQSGNDIAFRILQKGGQIRWAAVSWQTLYDEAGRSLGYRTSIRDITGRKQVEEALRCAHTEAERTSRAKSRFLAAASHDLRQPLQAINMFVAALKASIGDGDADAADIIASIQESLRATDDLLDALLDVSRLDAGVLQPRLRNVAVADLVDRMEIEFASQAALKGIVLRTVTSSAVVRTDPTLLERVLRNLVSNALRYTERGRLLIGCRRRGAALRVEVWDTGIGIPGDKIRTVFEEFYQLGNPERDRTRGLGLGLAIVDRVSRLLGHRIDVRSVLGKGSMFAIEIPIDPAAAAAIEAPEVEAPEAGALTGKLIVAIDDEPMQLRAMRHLFSRWGCAVVTGGSPAEALTHLVDLQRMPDAIVADYRLRGAMTGLEAIRTLRAGLGRTIPGIILTGDTEPARLREAEATGFALLHKPVDTTRLFAALARMVTQPPVR